MSDTPQAVIQEILSGDALSLGQAARKIPPHRGNAEHSSPSCIWRWIVAGAKDLNGTIVRLEAARVAGRWLTSSAALGRFFARLTPSADPIPTPAPSRKPAARSKSIEAARRKLATTR